MTIHELILSRLAEPFTGQLSASYLNALSAIEAEMGAGKWVATNPSPAADPDAPAKYAPDPDNADLLIEQPRPEPEQASIAVCEDPATCRRVAHLIAPAPAPEIAAVTPRQIRLALIDIGILPEQITAALSAIPNQKARAKALAEWEFAGVIARSHPLIPGLCAAFGMADAQVDALFAAAATN